MAEHPSLAETLAALRARLADGSRRAPLLLASFGVAALLEVAGVGLLPAFVAMLDDPRALLARAGGLGARLFAGMDDAQAVTALGAAVAAFFLLKNLLLGAIARFQAATLAAQQAKLSARLFATYLHRPYALYLKRNSADLSRDVTSVAFAGFSGVLVPACTVAVESLVALLVALLLLAVSPLATALAATLIGGTAAAFHFAVRGRLQRLGERQQRTAGIMARWVQQAFGGIKETKILGREDFFAERHARHAAEFARVHVLLQVLASMPVLFVETVVVCAMVAAAVALARSGTTLQSMFPTLVLFGVAALRLMPSATRIVGALATMRFHQPAAVAVLRELAADDARSAAPGARAERLPLAQGIEARGLSFTYEGAARPALREVSLRIPKGAMAAFVGRSGAGKSTLVDLLLGLHPPDAGAVLVDGRDIAGGPQRWQRNIGYVPQSVFLTDDSLRRNVAFGDDDAAIDDARVRRALEAAQLAEFLRGLPEGLDAPVGERGARVSGGQRQRIGVARALYRDPDVLVLDEPTTALDPRTADELGATLRALAGAKTILLIAHRMPTVKLCDVVFMLQDGALAGAGPYEALAASNPGFQALVE